MEGKYIYIKPQEELYVYAKDISTPAVIYDIKQLQNIVNSIKSDLKHLYNAELNFALKSCYNREVLNILVQEGLGCDVASVNECKLAMQVGFSSISTTAPVYSEQDMSFFVENEIIIDLDSIEQIEKFGMLFKGERIGLRVKMDFPKIFDNSGMFGNNSRFGVDVLNESLREIIDKYELKVKKLHVHTGQMTPEILVYKVQYLLTIAEFYKDVECIDLGGGLFHLYRDRKKLIDTFKFLSKIIKDWENENKRHIRLVFEPGGAIVTPCGYLITTVSNIKNNTYYNKRIVTVDSSAWNMAPWHKAEIINVSEESNVENNVPTLIAGNTLYELDFFGGRSDVPYSVFELGNVKVGDRLVLSMFGGYTFTNARKFNHIDNPKEYILKSGQLLEINR